jgi:hypothetical protein
MLTRLRAERELIDQRIAALERDTLSQTGGDHSLDRDD